MPNNNQNNDKSLNLLLSLLGKNKTAPKTANKEELSKYILENLNTAQTDAIQKIINNPAAAEELLKNPKAQEILKNLGNEK